MIYYIILFIILLCIVFYLFDNRISVVGKCGRSYYVIDSENEMDETRAANILCELNEKTQKLINILRSKYPDNLGVKKLVEEYDWHDFEEGSESFIIGKGDTINLCLRNENNKFFDINTQMFVVLHELAHIMTDEYGHPTEFWNNNKFLLKEAISAGVYNFVDYSLHPIKYCNGIIINSSVN